MFGPWVTSNPRFAQVESPGGNMLVVRKDGRGRLLYAVDYSKLPLGVAPAGECPAAPGGGDQ